jgi:hypothetical protein
MLSFVDVVSDALRTVVVSHPSLCSGWGTLWVVVMPCRFTAESCGIPSCGFDRDDEKLVVSVEMMKLFRDS